jgi:hypothetical protein
MKITCVLLEKIDEGIKVAFEGCFIVKIAITDIIITIIIGQPHTPHILSLLKELDYKIRCKADIWAVIVVLSP